jgi:hypothetical protein
METAWPTKMLTEVGLPVDGIRKPAALETSIRHGRTPDFALVAALREV